MVMAADADINAAFGGQAQIDCEHLAVWVVEIATRRIVRKPCKACQDTATATPRPMVPNRLAS